MLLLPLLIVITVAASRRLCARVEGITGSGEDIIMCSEDLEMDGEDFWLMFMPENSCPESLTKGNIHAKTLRFLTTCDEVLCTSCDTPAIVLAIVGLLSIFACLSLLERCVLPVMTIIVPPLTKLSLILFVVSLMSLVIPLMIYFVATTGAADPWCRCGCT